MLRQDPFLPPVRGSVLGVALLLLVPARLWAQSAGEEVRTIDPLSPVERELSGGERHVYLIHGQTGDLVHVVVDQLGIDVVVSVRAPDGHEICEIDSPNGSLGPEDAFFVLAETGDHRIEVRSDDKQAPVGRYELSMRSRRPVTPQDRTLLAAQGVFAEGRRHRREGTAAAQNKAIERYKVALPLWREAGSRLGEIMTFVDLGAAYMDLGESARAIEPLDQALPLTRALGDRRWEATVLAKTGAVAALMGEPRKALTHLEAAVAAFRAIGYRAGEAEALLDLGWTHESLGDKLRALEHYERALPIVRAVGDRTNEAVAWNNIGATYDTLGEKQKSLEAYKESLALRRAAKDLINVAQTLNNIAVVYASLNDTEGALAQLAECLKIYKDLGYRDREGRILHNIAAIQAGQNKTREALDTYGQALAAFRDTGDRRGEGGVLDRLGILYYSMGDQARALEHLDAALAIRRSQEDRGNVAITLHGLGKVHGSMGANAQALELQEQALALLRQVGLRDVEASALYEVARLRAKGGDLVAARESFASAIELIESLRGKAPTHALRLSYLASVHSYYEGYVDVLMRLHAKGPGQGWDALALDASERGRARGLIETLAEARVDLRKGVDPDLLAQERALQGRINTAAERQVQVHGGKHTPEQVLALDQEIRGLEAQHQEIQAEIRRASPRYADLMHPQPLSVAEIRRQVLDDPDTALLEYSLGEERSYAWVVATTGIVSRELPPRHVVDAAASRVYELLTARNQRPPADQGFSAVDQQYGEAAAALSQMILGPVAEALGHKRLVIVADGILEYVPFAALPPPARVPEAGVSTMVVPALAARWEIVHVPSASTLAVLRQEVAGRRSPSKTAAILADPVFDSQDPRVRGPRHPPAQPPANAVRALRDSGMLASDGRIPRLPYTREEARALSELARPGQVTLALDFGAGRELVLSSLLAEHRIVHIATHGVLNNEHPELSGVVLSLVDEQGRPVEGFLPLAAVYDLQLPVDLVVLSGCRTALGKPIRGEGLVGLTRGFLYAGARAVLASLWKVDDVATARLMEAFYRGLLQEGRTPAAALRSAQVALATEKRWRAPYYWAGFVLQGDFK